MNYNLTVTVTANPLDDCLSGAAESYIEEHPELAGYDLEPQWGDAAQETVVLTLPSHCRLVDDGNGGEMIRVFASADAARIWDRQIRFATITADQALDALVELDVQAWGEHERDASRRLHGAKSRGLLINAIVHQ